MDNESQEVITIKAQFGLFSLTISLQGGTHRAKYFHDRTREAFNERGKLKQRLHDYLFHEKVEESLLGEFDDFGRTFPEKFNVNIKRSGLF